MHCPPTRSADNPSSRSSRQASTCRDGIGKRRQQKVSYVGKHVTERMKSKEQAPTKLGAASFAANDLVWCRNCSAARPHAIFGCPSRTAAIWSTSSRPKAIRRSCIFYRERHGRWLFATKGAMLRRGQCSMTSNNIRYVLLMVVETAAAMFLFLTIFPIFRQVITQLGEPQDISPYQQSAVVCGALVLQACYWVRFRWVAVPAPFRNALVRHLFLFASRVSFFFGGALFSVLFFRHVPELDQFPSFIQGAVQAVGSPAGSVQSVLLFAGNRTIGQGRGRPFRRIRPHQIIQADQIQSVTRCRSTAALSARQSVGAA